MKTILTLIIWSAFALKVQAQGVLEKRIQLRSMEIALSDLMNTITDQTFVSFSHTNKLNVKQKIRFLETSLTLSAILKAVSGQTGFEYKLTGTDKILFFRKHSSVKGATISGFLKDAESGEALIGATVYDSKSQLGTSTNAYGFYSLTIPKATVSLQYSYVGYHTHLVGVELKQDTLLSLQLKENMLLEEVIVESEKEYKIHETSRTSTVRVPIRQIQQMPAFNGEVDLLKSLQLLPSVQSGNEGSAGMYVRGGGPDQNLMLVDGVPVYNATHLFGFYSIFNADAINNVELVKGGFPARYGGRLSSVVDINMKEGNMEEYHGKASIGIITLKGLIEGPIIKNKVSFMTSGRSSYLDPFAFSQIQDPDQANPKGDQYRFYDYNLKVNYKIDDKNKIYLSGYFGRDISSTFRQSKDSLITDIYENTADAEIAWGNKIGSIRWNHIFTRKIFSSLSLSVNRYDFSIGEKRSESFDNGVEKRELFSNSEYQSSIQDYSLDYFVEYTPNPTHTFRFGTQAIDHTFTPSVIAIQSSAELDENIKVESQKVRAFEYSFFAEDDFFITNKLKTNLGLRFNSYIIEKTDIMSLQPRIAMRYAISHNTSLKASYTLMQQNVHLLTNAGIGLPTDLWLPATKDVPSQQSHQFVLGAATQLGSNLELSIESYYKATSNLIEYENGASYLRNNNDWESTIERGKGRSYGVEWMLQRKTGRLSGWFGYTLAWTERQFDNLSNGEWYPYRYDRRHDLNLVGLFQLNAHLNFSATWVYGSGNAVTVPTDAYWIDENNYYVSTYSVGSSWLQFNYPKRNNFRMRSYHRLDLSANYQWKNKSVGHDIAISAYNIYNRRNPYFLEFGYDIDLGRVLRQESLFGIVPSIKYVLSF